ncbi:MAG: ACT domain-containing protein [Clostridia bacterium]|nr:ACT domain-containing protein [Clostridia bacterium]
MSNEFIIIRKDVLPEFFENVLKIKNGLQDGTYENITVACHENNISRSTYYKYKDSVFDYVTDSVNKRATIALILSHKAGALSQVCEMLSKDNISIMTISQSLPIAEKASVLVSVDVSNMEYRIEKLLDKLNKADYVVSATLLAIE